MPTAAQIRKIHTLKGALKLDDDTYRSMLSVRYDSSSSKGITTEQADDLIRDLEQKALDSGQWEKREQRKRPRNMTVPGRENLLKKIEACLTERKLPWNYATAMAKRMCRKESLEFCSPQDLYKIVQAFAYDAKRKGVRA